MFHLYCPHVDNNLQEDFLHFSQQHHAFQRITNWFQLVFLWGTINASCTGGLDIS